MKKFLSLLVVLLTTVASAWADGTPTVSFANSSITMDALAEQEVKINLSKAGKALSSLQMNITLPEGISYVDGSAALGSMADDAEISFKNYEGTNKYNVQVLPKTQKEFTGDDSDILTFKIKANKALTDQIKLTYIIGSTTTAEKVTMDDVSADITVNKIDPGFKFDKGTKENPVTIYMDETQTFSYTTSSTGEVILFGNSFKALRYVTHTLDMDNKTVTLLAIEGEEQERDMILLYKQLSDDVYNEGKDTIYIHYIRVNYDNLKDTIAAAEEYYTYMESLSRKYSDIRTYLADAIKEGKAALDKKSQAEVDDATHALYQATQTAIQAVSVGDIHRNTPVGRYGTICLPFKMKAEGAKLYSGYGKESGDAVVLTEVAENDIQAGVPYIYEATAAEQIFSYAGGEPVATPQNEVKGLWPFLNGVFEKTVVPTAAYVLQTQNDVQKFYVVAAGDVITLDPYKAYLTFYNAAPEAKSLNIEIEGATAVRVVNSMIEGNARIYDLSGRKLNSLQKGVNIVNGVKVIVK